MRRRQYVKKLYQPGNVVIPAYVGPNSQTITVLISGSHQGKPHPNQYRGLFNIFMSITQDANRAWFHHHCKREAHRILQPPFGESTKDIGMSDLMSLDLLAIH